MALLGWCAALNAFTSALHAVKRAGCKMLHSTSSRPQMLLLMHTLNTLDATLLRCTHVSAQAQQEVMQLSSQLTALSAEQGDVYAATSADAAAARMQPSRVLDATAGCSSPDSQLLSLLAERDAQLATMEVELAVARAALAGDAGRLATALLSSAALARQPLVCAFRQVPLHGYFKHGALLWLPSESAWLRL
jgi:hypothetical protein